MKYIILLLLLGTAASPNLNASGGELKSLAETEEKTPLVISLSFLNPQKELTDSDLKTLEITGFKQRTDEEQAVIKKLITIRAQISCCFKSLCTGTNIGDLELKGFEGLIQKCKDPEHSLIAWINHDLDKRLWFPHTWGTFKKSRKKDTSNIVREQAQLELTRRALYVLTRVCYGVSIQEFHGHFERQMKLPAKEKLGEWLNENILDEMHGEK